MIESCKVGGIGLKKKKKKKKQVHDSIHIRGKEETTEFISGREKC
jgi:hypothetical protein